MIDDDKLRKRYRELGSEEPTAALDRVILDAAHRAVAPKRFSQRWAVPVSLAAVLVLAVGVTLRMQQEQPGVEISEPPRATPSPAQSKPEAPAVSPAPAAVPPSEAVVEKKKAIAPPAKARATAGAEDSRRDRKQDAQAIPAASIAEERRAVDATAAPAPPPKPQEPKAFADSAERNMAAPPADRAAPVPPPQSAGATAASALAKPSAAAAPSAPAPAAPAAQRLEVQRAAPMQAPAAKLAKEAKDARVEELERIAKLRREGRHTEADEALAKFRRENPDYAIPEATWEQVKPR